MILAGKSVSGGIAIGKLKVYKKKTPNTARISVADTQAEVRRFIAAKEQAKRQLGELYKKVRAEAGEESAMIFQVHQLMLEDIAYIEAITNMILTQKVNVEFAVAQAGDNFSQMFAAMEDAYMRARAADVMDISNRMLSVLQGMVSEEITEAEPVILLAEDLSPSETVRLDKSKVLAFVTQGGSVNSHTAILARTMNIPALIGVDFSIGETAGGEEKVQRRGTNAGGEEDAMVSLESALGIVDADNGKLYVNPDAAVLSFYQEKQAMDEEKKRLLLEQRGRETVTLDGTRIQLYANIGSVLDAANILVKDADGIGLFRSEFLYMEAEDYPTEEAQFTAYKTVAENMAGKEVTIRTLDIGADKRVDYFQLEKEENPALGYRAIRICLDRKEVLRTQLRAIYRASYYGNISILFPMIISVDEVKQLKQIIAEVLAELDTEEILYKSCELGVMIETPAAVMISDLLAKEVDFFSVGTNDLIQYTLAIDRQNPRLAHLYNAHHPAVLRMLQMIVENGHKEGCRVGICGELAADLALTEQLLRMGYDELSVAPSMLLSVRERIRNIDLGAICQYKKDIEVLNRM